MATHFNYERYSLPQEQESYFSIEDNAGFPLASGKMNLCH